MQKGGFRLQKARRGPQRRRWALVRAAALLRGSAAQGAVAGGESGVAYANGRRHYEAWARARYGGCGHTLHCQLPAGAGAGALTVAGMLRGAVLYGGFECYGGFSTTP